MSSQAGSGPIPSHGGVVHIPCQREQGTTWHCKLALQTSPPPSFLSFFLQVAQPHLPHTDPPTTSMPPIPSAREFLHFNVNSCNVSATLHCATNFQCEFSVCKHTLDFGYFIDIAIGQSVIVVNKWLKGVDDLINTNIAWLFNCAFYV